MLFWVGAPWERFCVLLRPQGRSASLDVSPALALSWGVSSEQLQIGGGGSAELKRGEWQVWLGCWSGERDSTVVTMTDLQGGY